MLQEAVSGRKPDTNRWIGLVATSIISLIAVIIGLVMDAQGSPGTIKLSLSGSSLHYYMEMASILVCFAIFFVAVYSHPIVQNHTLLYVGLAFLITGLLDILHLSSDIGISIIPIYGDTDTNSILYHALSRLVCALGLLIAVSSKESSNAKFKASFRRLSALLAVGLIVLFITLNPLQVEWVVESAYIRFIFRILQALTLVLLIAAVVFCIEKYTNGKDAMSLKLASYMIIMLGSDTLSMLVEPHSLYGDGLAHAMRFLSLLLIFNVFFIIGIRTPYTLLSQARDALNSYVKQLDSLVLERTNELTAVNQRLVADVEMARDVQRSMLPSLLPKSDMLIFSAGYVPAERLSGDFYDVFRIDSTRYGICIGDVAGHGVSAAMLTVFAFQNVQALHEEFRGINVMFPAFVLKNLFDGFNATNFRDELYMVIFYCIFNTETGILSYSSGGLNTTPVRLRPDGTIQLLESDGVAICKLGELIKPNYQNHQVLLFPGDKLILYTDGLVESSASDGRRYTQERLHTLLSSKARLGAESLKEAILQDVSNFTDKALPKDDVTLLVMEVSLPF